MSKKNETALSWIFRQIKRFIPGILLITVLDAVSALTGVALAFISKGLLDKSGNDSKLFFGIVLIAVVIVTILITALVSIINVHVNGKMVISMRTHLFSQLVRKKYPAISKHHTGDLLNRFTSDVDIIANTATSTLPNAVSMVVRIIAGIGALVIMNPLFALAVLLIGFCVPALGRLLSQKYKFMHKEVQQTEGVARSFMQESFANIVVIKSFRSEAPILGRLSQYLQDNLRIKIKRNFVSVAIHFLLNSFFNLGYYGVLIWGAFSLSSGLTYGTLNAYLQLIAQLQAPLKNVSGILPQYYQALASAERLMDIDNIENEARQPDEAAAEKLRSSFERLSVNNVAFAYDNELILKNCSFEVQKGTITAITGESGCGKSTLFKLLLGLYEPSGGSITVNGDTTVDPSTRCLFSYVPQGNMILSGTIRENITMCDPDISDEQIISAARAAAIYDYIETLPDGLDTVLSERGAGLSEGQIQRISIARALLNDTPVLLLDEATSALDEATETLVLGNIKSMTDKTVLFITHRNTSISVCDRIVHAADGKYTVVK